MAIPTSLTKSIASQQEKWDSGIPPALHPAAGVVGILALRCIARKCRLGAPRRLGQLATGFPISGRMAQKRVLDFKPPKNPIMDQPQLIASAESRFRERSAKYGTKNSLLLRNEAVGQVHRGWLSRPVPLGESGKPEGCPPNGFNVSVRIGVAQASKLREFGDLKHCLANQACVVDTPVQLASCGHLEQLCKCSCRDRRDWALFKEDHEAEYKQLPLAPSAQRRAVLALRHPSSGKRCGFRPHTLMFGAAAAVLHYNAFLRLITALVNQLMGIPLICCLDDCAAPVPGILANKERDVSPSFCSLLGIRMTSPKSDVGDEVTFLCLRGGFSAPRKLTSAAHFPSG